MKRSRAVGPAVLLAVTLGRLVVGDPFAAQTDPTAPRPISAEARAVLDGLDVGDALGPFEVTRISGPEQRQIVVEIVREGSSARIWVARRGASSRGAPVSTDRFDLFYGPPPPGTPVADDGAVVDALRELAARIENGGAEVPTRM